MASKETERRRVARRYQDAIRYYRYRAKRTRINRLRLVHLETAYKIFKSTAPIKYPPNFKIKK